MASVFVGRTAETEEFRDWVENESSDPGAHRAGLVVGNAGLGKSALLKAFEQVCLSHIPSPWYVQHAELNANESASEFLERLLNETHRLFKGTLLPRGPADARLLSAFLRSIPGAGGMLAELVIDRRPGWIRFVDYLKVVSASLSSPNGRLVLLVDPDVAMNVGQATDWFSLAARVPLRVRVVIAQRMGDVIAVQSQWRLKFRGLPSAGRLGDLEYGAVARWYQAEFEQNGRLQAFSGWPLTTREGLIRLAFAKYQGHPFSHDAVIRGLAREAHNTAEPAQLIDRWPPDLKYLMDAEFEELARLGEDQLRAALTLRVLSISSPGDAWAAATKLSPERLTVMLADPQYRKYFDQDPAEGYRPYHALFGERLEEELGRNPRRAEELAENAWSAVEERISTEGLIRDPHAEFYLRVGTRIVERNHDYQVVLKRLAKLWELKRRFGLMDSAKEDMEAVLRRFGDVPEVRAAGTGNLGVLALMRGDVAEAESRYRQALEIEETRGNWDGIVTAQGNIGNILQEQGRLGDAEEMFLKCMEIDLRLGGRERRLSITYGNLTTLYRLMGRLAEAKAMCGNALESATTIGDERGMANAYGRLASVKLAEGEKEEAEGLYLRALELYRRNGDMEAVAGLAESLGALRREARDPEASEEYYRLSIECFEQIQNVVRAAIARVELGRVFCERGEVDRARELWRRAEVVLEGSGRQIELNTVRLLVRALGESECR